jgi:hypothetical protein
VPLPGRSFIGAAFAALVSRFDPDSTARQRLPEKHLDFGVHASQVGYRATLHRVNNRFLRPERERNAFRAWGPSSLGHDRSRIEGAGIDHWRDLAVANQIAIMMYPLLDWSSLSANVLRGGAGAEVVDMARSP